MNLTDFNINFGTYHISEKEEKKAQSRKAEHVYNTFVNDILNQFDSRKIFQPNEVREEMRPPYTYTEIKSALEYGAENKDDVELLESDMDLFLYED